MRRNVLSAIVSAAAIVASASAASAMSLGCQKVSFIKDVDVINVGRDAGKFSRIQLRVSGNTIEMRDLKVVYGNGQVDDIPVRSKIRKGQATRWIDLKGQSRFIKEVVMSYASKPSLKGQATVCVYARR